MHLLNTQTLKLEHYNSEYDVPYCTLSHRWLPGDQEMSYQETGDIHASSKRGAVKVRAACSVARGMAYRYIWVDTCCIDKTSSAALSEAINSMYRYYQRGQKCLAYFADSRAGDNMSFERSKWFTRSWTLQELLAPPEVVFYDARWAPVGTRTLLRSWISAAANIDESALDGGTPQRFSIAERMSWAARRSAARTEDIAYSLMGLFDVNMPMLYGEGAKAFTRLQEEIIKHSDDQTLFAWSAEPSPMPSGLLATSPRNFLNGSQMRPSTFGALPSEISLTRSAIEMKLSMFTLKDIWKDGIFLALLDVVRMECAGVYKCVGIFLTHEKGYTDSWYRIAHPNGTHLFNSPYENFAFSGARRDSVRICPPQPVNQLSRCPVLFVTSPSIELASPADCVNRVHWHSNCQISIIGSSILPLRYLNVSRERSNPVCTIDLTARKASVQFIHFGFDNTQRPVCLITDASYAHYRKRKQFLAEWHEGLVERISSIKEDKETNHISDFWRIMSVEPEQFPTRTALEEADIEYEFGFPWNEINDRKLTPYRHHIGFWAVIGNAGQDLRFSLDFGVGHSHVNHIHPLNSTNIHERMKYTADIAFVQTMHSSETTWHMIVKLHDEPLNERSTKPSTKPSSEPSSEPSTES